MQKRTSTTNSLSLFPDVAAEFHSLKNKGVTPYEITAGSSKKVWWQCAVGHEWQATVSDRVAKKSRCPYCAGRRATEDRNLEVNYPEVAKQWHKTKNGSLLPKSVLPYSGKKVWWLCSEDHEWQAVVSNRTKGRAGCPFCTGRYATEENNLLATNPELAAEWHPDKNGTLTPENVTPGSNKKVWWLCPKGHEWAVAVLNRSQGTGCPYCANKKVGPDNSLATLKPEIAQEWDFERNKDLTPDDVTPGRDKKAWWLCQRGHSWEALIKDRTRGVGCPVCSPNTSKLEIRIFTELDGLFDNVQWQEKIEGKECDVYLPDNRLGVEVDGYYWHKNKDSQDREKTKHFRRHGIDLIRVREPKLPRLSDVDVLVGSKEGQYSVFCRLLQEIADLRPEVSRRIKGYISTNQFQHNWQYREICANLPGPPPHLSVAKLRPDLASQWHLAKNRPLLPEHFSLGSKHQAWWICDLGHEWQANILNRANGSGCPYCAGKRASVENNLQSSNPTVAAQWHPEKNNGLTPADVTANSGRVVWWQCENGHEWRAQIRNRKVTSGQCPSCKTLAFQYPELANQWHPSKNAKLEPGNISSGSGRKVWWQCERGHEWTAEVRARVAGSDCPICNSLTFKRPELAAEFHPTKNKGLTTDQLSVGSRTKVWWLCSEGHEWPAAVGNRTKERGSGCPKCARLKRANRKSNA
jgi:hypothetical protein